MKYLVLGDIHGRDIWRDIVAKHSEEVDKIIFLGDYVSTHEGISAQEQLEEVGDILRLKELWGDKIILLRGNHDMQHLGYYWAECSGFDWEVYAGMQPLKDQFLNLTQWIYKDGSIVFSHAGVSQVWLDNNHLTLDDINNQEPSEIFGFTSNNWQDHSGESVTQPPTWIRPNSLMKCNVAGYTQVVGHTPIRRIFAMRESTKNKQLIYMCDALGSNQYLIIEDNKFLTKFYEIDKRDQGDVPQSVEPTPNSECGSGQIE